MLFQPIYYTFPRFNIYSYLVLENNKQIGLGNTHTREHVKIFFEEKSIKVSLLTNFSFLPI